MRGWFGRSAAHWRWLLPLLPLVLAAAGAWAWRTRGAGGGGRITMGLSAFPGDWLLAAGVLTAAGTLICLMASARAGVVRRRAVDQASRQAASDRQRLMGRLDHELKNPLTAIRLALANVTADDPRPDQRAGLVSIEEQVLRLSRLTADLRKIADVETSRLERSPVDLTVLLQEAVEIVGEQPRAQGVRVRLDLPSAPWPLPRAEGDEDLLSLAIVNLLDNAVKFTPPGGAVEVRARETPAGVLIEVADTGDGIAPEDLPLIWDELFRGRQVRAVLGSGLGLPLVRAVVERHGGSVSAESRPGEGTVVRLILPVERAVL